MHTHDTEAEPVRPAPPRRDLQVHSGGSENQMKGKFTVIIFMLMTGLVGWAFMPAFMPAYGQE
jgi:hypothetical protein